MALKKAKTKKASKTKAVKKKLVKKPAARKRIIRKKPSKQTQRAQQANPAKGGTKPANWTNRPELVNRHNLPEPEINLPQGYDDNKIVLMVRDPYWLYAYWEINQKRIEEIVMELHEKFAQSSLVLRVYDTSNWKFFDINVHGYLSNWYINVGRPNTSFCIDVGFVTPDGVFICAARSNIVTTPRDGMSNVIDEEWMIPDWERMYALSGGFGRGKGSMEIKEMIDKRMWHISSSASPKRQDK